MFIARLLVTGLAMATASTTLAGQQIASGDFNGDGKNDLAIGVPFEDLGTVTDAGVVHVLYARGVGISSAKDDFWHQNKPSVPDTPEFFDHFGRAVAAGDFNGDGFDDLAIATDENSGEGSVMILYGAANGLVIGGNQVLTQANVGGNALGTDNFGFALAVGDFDNDGFDDLAVGEPSDDINFQSSAGSVSVFYGSGPGLGAEVQFFYQQQGFIGDLLEAGDSFGTSIAAGDFDDDGFDDLAIGVPTENIGSVGDAGLVHVLYGTANMLTTVGCQRFQQNTPGVADAIETGDLFGQTLAAGDFDNDGFDDLAIGAVGEKIDSEPKAGAVHVLYGGANGVKRNGGDFWHQNRGGIEDQCDPDDDFGFALATGDFDSDGFDDLAIGARGETFEDEDEELQLDFCGVVHVLYGTGDGLASANSQLWHLNLPNVPGEAEESRFGSALCVGDFDGDGFVDLAGSAPTEEVDAVANAGAVHIFHGSAGRLITTHPRKYWHQAVTGVADECDDGDGFGGTP